MPIYDYVCEACGHRLEVMHGVDGQGPTNCPACGSGPMRKAFAPPTVVFKGSGWAKKDRRTASRAAANAEAGKGEAGKTEAGKTEAGKEPAEAASKGSAEPKDAGVPPPSRKQDSGDSSSSSSAATE